MLQIVSTELQQKISGKKTDIVTNYGPDGKRSMVLPDCCHGHKSPPKAFP